MSKPNYTMRQGGYEMVTIRVPVDIARATVEGLALQIGVSESAALGKIRDAVEAADPTTSRLVAVEPGGDVTLADQDMVTDALPEFFAAAWWGDGSPVKGGG